jgi:indolepyruvate ferredoxin oxidoreductase
VKGFCPSFVTIEGGRLRKGKAAPKEAEGEVPSPQIPSLAAPYGILVTGIGGTGVITIGQIIGVAAHVEGKGVTVLDMSGLAQKYGAVMSHVQVAASPDQMHATRIDTGGANLVLGCDLVVTASTESLAKMAPKRTRALVNASVTPTAEFVRNPNWQLPGTDLQKDVEESCEKAEFVAATAIATGLMGDAIATNMFMLGYAYQKGWIPLAAESLERAIELNGVAVEFNQKSFVWGRRAALDLEKVRRIAMPAEVIPIEQHFSRNLDELIERRVRFLTEYQNRAYAERYRALVEKVRAKDEKLAEVVARNYAKLLAYKDEYEVARLHADPNFRKKIETMFEGDYRVVYHLAPPLLTRKEQKMRFGPWILPVFKVLRNFKFLRGSALDPFGYTQERRTERALIGEYEDTIARLLTRLNSQNEALALEIAAIPDEIRGFGHIKARNLAPARKKWQELLARYEAGQPAQRAAA